MKWKPSRNAAENARINLPKLAGKYFRAGRAAADDQIKPKELHKFRIATKRFRYSLELFRPIYGVTLDRHIKLLRGIQDALGKVSDYQTIQEMIAGDKQLKSHLEKAQRKRAQEFRAAWKKFDSNGQLKRWKAYLARAQRPDRRVRIPRKASKRTASSSVNRAS